MKPVIIITALLCITALAITAMLLGFDGAVLTSAISMLAGLGGFAVGRKKNP